MARGVGLADAAELRERQSVAVRRGQLAEQRAQALGDVTPRGVVVRLGGDRFVVAEVDAGRLLAAVSRTSGATTPRKT